MLKIDYNLKNHIPIATDHNAVIDSPSINLCITDGDNQNMSPPEKRLLEWHFQFRHQNLGDTQIIL